MRNKLHIGWFLIILCLISAIAYTQSKGQEVNDVARHLSSVIAQSGKKTVAVVDFTDLQGRVTEFGRFLAEEFSVALAVNPSGFKVIDRTNIRTILQEHKLASTGIIDPQTARKLGEITGVQALVTGTVTPFGDNLRISVKVLDAETAEIISGVSSEMPRNKAIDDLLARGISGGDQIVTLPTGKAESAKSRDLPEPTTAEIGDFLYSIQGCRPVSDKVECWGTVANGGSKLQGLQIDPSKSYLIDDLGNQSGGRDASVIGSIVGGIAGGGKISVTLGSNGSRAELEPNLPISLHVSGNGLSDEAKSVSLVLVTDHGRGVMKNVKLQHR